MSENSTLRKLFGTYLRELREAQKLTVEKVTHLLDLENREVLRSWEDGVSLPPDSIIDKLGQLYGVSPEELRLIFEVEAIR